MTSFKNLLWIEGVLQFSLTHAATVYLAGDSTMARQGGGKGVSDGWGEYLQASLSTPVINQAIGGRSARSFTREKRFDAIANALKPGDFVVIEFGHNDGGSLANDNGRSDCPGSGSETCRTNYGGKAETVLTFPAYLQNAARTFKGKGASVIISSQTPNNPYESGRFQYSPSRFVDLAKTAASRAGTVYVDHGRAANFFQSRSASTVNSYFPSDHTHTSLAGAKVVADAFVRGLLCGNSLLKNSVQNVGSVDGTCQGLNYLVPIML